ncbi:hypothetical protein [Candidatus Parabeggiatoa sp. HSG14]|uniref:hypothetical protein n=1 Tax=Candidatus Parabeggiatoa sp. HSG14 TaxID=3055593 RepID=UPI0025A8A495|nr:hypothetical protein [Thiotrichales bacterium HSG14]
MSVYSGKSKIDFCHRLGNDWQDLATCLEIPTHRRNQFPQGRECQAIWEWLEEDDERLQKLSEALKFIKRDDLLSVLQPNEITPQKKYKVNPDIDLRPHLPNRRPQERQLGKAIQTHHDKQRPLLCLIHSNECQCSDSFVDRLAKYYLPTVIHGDGITSHFIHCDFSEDIDDLHQDISEELSLKLLGKRFVSDSEIVDAIVNERNPIILHSDMCTKNWSRCGGIKVIQNFIEFWAKLELPPTHRHLLLICLYFNYKDIKQSRLKSWLQKKSINDQIREKFKNLEKENFLEKFGINGIVLPELTSIEKEDVEAWAREHLRSVSDIVRPKIDNLFKSPDETIPMCDLARKLRKILEEFPPDVFKV